MRMMTASTDTPDSTDIERAIGSLGLSLARAAGGVPSGLFDPSGLRGRLLAGALRDADLRTRLFRFVDVLPQLEDDGAAIAEHFRAYLNDATDTPATPAGGLESLWDKALKLGGRPWASFAVRRGVRGLARQFLAEESPTAIKRLLHKLAALPAGVSLDAVGEAVLSEAEADTYRNRVLALIATLVDTPDANVSVKLSALTPRFDPVDPLGSAERVHSRLHPIIQAARDAGVGLTVDMEQFELKPLIQDIFLNHLQPRDNAAFRIGIVVQAYLRDAQDDLERLLDFADRYGRPIAVRLVKGAYWDTEQAWAAQRDWPVPVLLDKAATDLQFEALTRRLMARTDRVYPMIASHNLRSQTHALAVARALNLPASAWEAQMLYGMAEPLRDALIGAGVRMRIYVPTGDLVTGIAYLIRRLLENTAGNSILRQTYAEGRPARELLRRPEPAPMPEPSNSQATAMRFRNAPETDFSQESARTTYSRALAAVRGSLGNDYPLPGNGGFQGDWLVSTNPADPGEIVGRVRTPHPDQVNIIVADAVAGFHAWRAETAHTRAERLRVAAHLIDDARARFAAWIILEAGKNWREADADVAESVDVLRYYADHIEALDGWRPTRHDPGELNDCRFEAVGPTAVISPWNFPLALLAGMSAAALAAGCSVILKPASRTPVIAWHFRQALLEAGIPANAAQWLPGAGGALGERLVAHPDVAAIAFTGSREVGLAILERAHKRTPEQRLVKRVACEMGGKNAIIVDADADLDDAVAQTLASAFGYQGQKCSAASRVIVVGHLHNRFVDRLGAALDAFEYGPPEHPRHVFGPLIDAQAVTKAESYLEIGRQEGRLAYRGRAPQDGHYFAPAIFTDIKPGHRLAREEIFAPLLAVLRAPDFDTALDMALDSDYALTGGVFSRLPEHLQLARARLRVGNLYLNRRITGAKVGAQPFGGVGLSGGGIQAGGAEYIKQFLWQRTITENTLRHGFVG